MVHGLWESCSMLKVSASMSKEKGPGRVILLRIPLTGGWNGPIQFVNSTGMPDELLRAVLLDFGQCLVSMETFHEPSLPSIQTESHSPLYRFLNWVVGK